MGMNTNGFFRPGAGWQDRIKYNPEFNPQKLEAEPIKPGNMQLKHNVTPEDLQKILNNIDNPDIPKFDN